MSNNDYAANMARLYEVKAAIANLCEERDRLQRALRPEWKRLRNELRKPERPRLQLVQR